MSLLRFFLLGTLPDVSKLKAKGDREALVKTLRFPVWKLRHDAAVALVELGDPRGMDELFKLLQLLVAEARKAAAASLAQIGDPRAVRHLKRCYQMEVARPDKGSDDSVREAVLASLARFFPGVPPEEVGRKAMVEYYQAELKDEERAEKAALALGHLQDPDAVEPLMAALENKGSIIRRGVAEALGKIGDRRAVGPLLRVLEDSDVGLMMSRELCEGFLDLTRTEILRAWMSHSWSEMQNFILAALLAEEFMPFTTSPRRAAAEALGKLGDREAVEPLFALLSDRYWDVRATAAEALGKLGDLRAVEPILTLLKIDEHFMVRRAAAEALGRLGSAKAIPSLLDALQDPGGVVMTRARVESLGRSRGLNWLAAFNKAFPSATWRDRDLTVRGAAINSLKELGAQME